MKREDVEILKAYADHNMNASQASKGLYMHPNSLKYRLDRIKQETGLDPRNFYDLRKLLEKENL